MALARRLPRQQLAEAVRPIPVPGMAAPPLTPTRRLPIPARPNHTTAGMSGITTTRHLHAKQVGGRPSQPTNRSILIEWEHMFAPSLE
jgi:hypothetical protein